MNDLCLLLRTFGLKNIPLDFRAIQRNINENRDPVLQGNQCFICPMCGRKGTDKSKCQNSNCGSSEIFRSTPTTLWTFKLLPQITSILERTSILPEAGNVVSEISDVQNGPFHREVVMKERLIESNRQIITFLLNSDGVVLKNSNRSIWVTCMAINELPRRVRFNMNNIIICTVSTGSSKPNKKHFQSFMEDWVLELRQLENGFFITPPHLINQMVKVHAYMIAAVLDKPAQALVMNLTDPTGYYSCARCTIRGNFFLKFIHSKKTTTVELCHEQCVSIKTEEREKDGKEKTGRLDNDQLLRN